MNRILLILALFHVPTAYADEPAIWYWSYEGSCPKVVAASVESNTKDHGDEHCSILYQRKSVDGKMQHVKIQCIDDKQHNKIREYFRNEADCRADAARINSATNAAFN